MTEFQHTPSLLICCIDKDNNTANLFYLCHICCVLLGWLLCVKSLICATGTCYFVLSSCSLIMRMLISESYYMR